MVIRALNLKEENMNAEKPTKINIVPYPWSHVCAIDAYASDYQVVRGFARINVTYQH